MGDTSFSVLGKALFVGGEFLIVFLLCSPGAWKALAHQGLTDPSLPLQLPAYSSSYWKNTWEMRIFFVIMQRRLWNKNSGAKINSKFWGRTKSLHRGLCGTLLLQNKARPSDLGHRFQWCTSVEKILLSFVFCWLKEMFYAQRNKTMKALLMSIHISGFYRKVTRLGQPKGCPRN